MKHTPGPWTAEKFTLVVSHETRTRIADVNGRDAQERAANARLIAAAPEMLLMAYDSLDFLDGLSDYEVPLMLRERLRQSIAKAQGLDPENDKACSPSTSAEAKRE